jgi:hypothetical protein
MTETQNIKIKYDVDSSDLDKSARALGINVKEEERLAAASKEVDAAMKKQGAAAEEAGKKGAAASKEAVSGIGLLNDGLKNITGLIAGAFAFDQLLSFGRKVIDITAEFQKMSAVLTNALGSSSAAASAMYMIQDLASRTPFSVQELTNSFIKLVNMGFEPTEDEIIKLGDLASSTGKSFDELAEALIDAQTGEFERLKAFGVRASKEGENVTFSFKGVETQTKFTNEAIREYILSLGDLEGVSGAMEAISGTLAGKISNLGDTFDQLFLTLGNASSGIMADTIDLLAEMTKNLTYNVTNGFDLGAQRAAGAVSNYKAAIVAALSDLADKTKAAGGDVDAVLKNQIASSRAGLEASLEKARAALKVALAYDEALAHNIDAVLNPKKFRADKEALAAAVSSVKMLEGEISELDGLDISELIQGDKAKQEETLGMLAALRAELTATKKLHDAARSKPEIAKHGARIEDIEEEIKALEALGKTKKKAEALAPVASSLGGEDPGAGEIARLDAIAAAQEKADKAALGRSLDFWNDVRKLRKEAHDKELDEKKKHAEKVAKFENELKEAAIGAAIDFGSTLLAVSVQNKEAELAELQDKHEQDVFLAGDNKEKKAELDRAYAEKEKAVRKDLLEQRRKQAIFDKAVAIFDIITNTASAVSKAVALSPLTFGLPWSAVAAGIGALQVANVIAQPLPKFARGVERLEGPGTKTSDSILAQLSRGERVVSADTNSEYFGTLTAIHNRRIPAKFLNSAVERYLKFGEFTPPVLDLSGRAGGAFDDSRILSELRDLPDRITVNEHRYDERGFRSYTRRKNARIQNINDQNRIF